MKWGLDIDPRDAKNALFWNDPEAEGESAVTQGFGTVIPEEIRRAVRDVEPGGKLLWQVREGLLVVLPIPADPVLGFIGILEGLGLSTEKLLEERRKDRELEERLEREQGIPPAERG